MLAETMKTFPSTGSLNTDVSNYESSHRIFIDMVNELKKVVNKTNDLGMLPLECQYLNKTALTALVGLRPEPTKHFIVKRKPKSFFLRQELIQKSMDAQSSLKKISAPTVPLRSRGIPRKMTDTTPMKGIPSRVPTGGFRSPPTSQANNRPSVSRAPAGRKDGGIKLLEIEDQPLGYAAAKKRKRQQELEEQQKRALENQEKTATSENNANTANTTAAAGNTPTTPSTPDYAAGLTATNVYSQPATPMPSSTITSETIQIPITTATATNTTTQIVTSQVATSMSASVDTIKTPAVNHVVKKEVEISAKRIKMEHTVSQEDFKMEIKTEAPTKVINNNSNNLVTAVPSIQQQPPTITLIKTEPKTPSTPKITRTLPTLITTSVANSSGKSIVLTPTTTTIAGQSYVTIKAVSTPLTASTSGAASISNLSNLNIPSTTKIVRTVQYVSQSPQTRTNTTASVAKTPTIITGKPTLMTKTVNAAGQQQIQKPTILSNIILTPQQSNVSGNQTPGTYTLINSPNKIMQRVVASGQNINIPTLTSTMARPNQQILQSQQNPTKIVQIQTTPAILKVAQNQNSMKNIPPLISTQQPTTALLNYQGGTRKVTITQQPAPNSQNNPNIQRITLSQAQQAVQQQQQQQLQQNQHNQQTGTHVITSANPQKLTQLMVPSNQKGKTIILTNPNLITQKNSVILQSVGPSGNPVYQQIPLQNVSGLTGIRGATIVTSTPPGLIKTVGGDQSQQKNNQQIPALVPTSNLTTQTMPGLTPVMIATSNHQQQQQLPTYVTKVSQPNQVQIRPVLTTINQQPQLTLIQRPGQQPQLVQTIQQPQQQTIQRAVITTTQPQQTIQIQQQPTQIVQQQTSQASSGTTQRRGLSLSVSI